MSESPVVSAVLPLGNKRAFLEPCLTSIVRATEHHGAVEVIVVDNGSSDGSAELAARWSAPVRVLRLTPRTIGAARNAGAAMARGRILSFVDSDCVVPLDYFAAIERVLAETGADAAGFEVRLPDDQSWIERVWGALHRGPGDGPRHYVNAASFAVRRDAFERIGGFDEHLVTGEDTDICLRLTRSGGRIWGARALEVLHLDNPRTLAAFFAKERWRGLGTMTPAILSKRPRTVLALLVFAATLLVAAGLALTLPPGPAAVLGPILLVLSVPTATVAYRWKATRRVVAPVPAVLLYVVYYAARLSALPAAIRRVMRPARIEVRA